MSAIPENEQHARPSPGYRRPAAAELPPEGRLLRHDHRHVHGDPGCPDRRQLAGRYPGRIVGQHRGNQLGPDLLPDRRSGDDPAVRHAGAHPLHARAVQPGGAGLHGDELRLLAGLQHRDDDPGPLAAGFLRRGDDSVDLLHRLHHVPAQEHGEGLGRHRAGRHHGADHRADAGRLHHPDPGLALAVQHQHHPRPDRRRDGVELHRHRQAGTGLSARARRVRSGGAGDLAGHTELCAGGGAAARLVRGSDDLPAGRAVRRRGLRVLLARLHLPPADCRSARLQRP